MKSYAIFGLFTVLLIGGSIYPALGQSEVISNGIVINEVDINPPGNDSSSISEWVELYNPTDTTIDIGGWQIASTTVLKKTFTIPQGVSIESGGFLTFSYTKVWFTDVSELVQLKDRNGVVVDQTPRISDLKNDYYSWQRNFDGFDTDSDGDWSFNTSTPGSSNGKLDVAKDDETVSISVSADKDAYTFGEKATISGSVSEQIYQYKPFFEPARIFINISGPNGFFKTINLYPDLNQNYKIELDLRTVLGFYEGIYNVSVKYADAFESTQFTLGNEIKLAEEIDAATFAMISDKQSYLPGQTVKIWGFTSEIVPFEGLKLQVTNPQGLQVYSGTLYPQVSGIKGGVRGGELYSNSEADFTATVFMTTVNPVYGQYHASAKYASHTAELSFDLVKDLKEATNISLKTEKQAYGLGDTVLITGRLNNVWIPSLDIEILQTGKPLPSESSGRGSLDQVSSNILKILDAVRPLGDGSFTYEIKIPNNLERFGDYRISVSKDIGAKTIFFKVVQNPDEYVGSTMPFTVSTNMPTYNVGDIAIITGKIRDPIKRSSFETPPVIISFKDENGNPLTISAVRKESRVRENNPLVVPYTLSSIPDIAGNFRLEVPLSRTTFSSGEYTIHGNFDDGRLKVSTSIILHDTLAKGKSGIVASLNKKVFGLDEEVILTGTTISTGDSSYQIILTKPDGNVNRYGTTVDAGKFSWYWTTPLSEEIVTKSTNDRSNIKTIFGTYRVTISSDTGKYNLFFKVSPNPEDDVLNVKDLEISTDKSVYKAGEKLKITGLTLIREQGSEGLVVPERVNIVVRSSLNKVIHDASVYPDLGGAFGSVFELPVTVFKEGNYKVTAAYQNLRDETIFRVENDFNTGGDEEIKLLLETDKDEYSSGEFVQVTGRVNKIVYLDNIRLGVTNEKNTEINCGSFVCGPGVPIVTVFPDPSGTFHHDHKIPFNAALGNYVIRVDTEFGTFSKKFSVIDKPEQIPIGDDEKLQKKLIEKFNRITDSTISIVLDERQIDENILLPRVIQGSLFTSVRGAESSVNIQVTTENGTCVIGQEQNCLVSQSTRVPGAIYKMVEIGDKNYKVRYSGPDVRLEKFDILPESSTGVMLGETWNVQIIKDAQPSRFYYKISYSLLE